jgi:two-component system phosphate regulon response regulator PhoB
MSDLTNRPHTILAVDSGTTERQRLRSALVGLGLDLVEATGLADALEQVEHEIPSIVLSESRLADGSGFSLCRLLRDRAGHEPMPIMLVSDWSNEADRVLAFECGADDFIAKPYYPRELASRVRALLRRSDALRLEGGRIKRLSAEPICVDHDNHRVTVDGNPVVLTRREFSILGVLADQRGMAISREDLIARAWRGAESLEPRTVDTHIKSIRRKLGDLGGAIETVRGIGYRLAESTGPTSRHGNRDDVGESPKQRLVG